ncbi:MAG: bifunctional diaminohydroxyphosphoribosylaminopyrimidine deaminase/5-amino-6-(5-phosphoribosylamino)uracil reductase RibD [Weeksellaceae bacterium]|nr:bifunctional diaminohydroxyphosphoribosylaminopyrimidine deaminase/5-amino-6-(5-phosphoribosylamino)uracil reductase RibD [Weeksellaceae bacterium]
MNHESYIKRCIELARKAEGKTYPNPMVGSVIVYNNRIIGEGYHKRAGTPHAEINAISSVHNKELLKDSTIYVSLEPCAHHGRTPPCADRIVETGFKKVVIGTLDSHDKVNGKGKQIIENVGIEVISGTLEEECRELNKRFFTFHQKKRPYIILKWAQSGDGFLDQDFKPIRISNSITDQFVHQMRADEHAILVGTNTAINDNPSLTVRHVEGQNPIRILIDLDLKVPLNYSLYDDEVRTLIFNSQRESDHGKTKLIKVDRMRLVENLMLKLYEEQIQSVIVEGGSFTLQQFINLGLWDEMVIIKNEQLQLRNGTKVPQFSQRPLEKKQYRDNTIEFFRK